MHCPNLSWKPFWKVWSNSHLRVIKHGMCEKVMWSCPTHKLVLVLLFMTIHGNHAHLDKWCQLYWKIPLGIDLLKSDKFFWNWKMLSMPWFALPYACSYFALSNIVIYDPFTSQKVKLWYKAPCYIYGTIYCRPLSRPWNSVRSMLWTPFC